MPLCYLKLPAFAKMLLPPFHNVSHSSIFNIYIDINEFRHIYIYVY